MMTGRRRLFIGNLHRETNRNDLQSLITTCTTINVHSVEIRQKNEATFAFVDVGCQNEAEVSRCMDELNKKEIRGQLLKVQLAKENFIERLKKEREAVSQYPERPQIPQRDEWRPRHDFRSRPPENFDFEIVSVSKTQNQKSNDSSASPKKKLASQGNSDSESDSENDDDEKNGIPMFRGLGFYPGLSQPRAFNQPGPQKLEPKSFHHPPTPVPIQPQPMQAHDQISQRMLAIAANKALPRPPLSIPSITPKFSSDNPPTSLELTPKPLSMLAAGGLKLNPKKREKSDQLRLQSFESRHQLQQSRSNLIRNALSNQLLQRNEDAAPKSKKSKSSTENSDFLFGKEEEDDDEDYSIRVKPQYEGKAGQKMMELNANFAWDKRFQIDERFAEADESEPGQEDEATSQLNILGQIIGKTIQKTPKPKKNLHENAVLTRYDPTKEEHRVFEVEHPEIETPKKSEVPKKSEPVPVAVEPTPLEKPTFKIAPNLKNLFNDSSFSLLSSFGNSSIPTSNGDTKSKEEENGQTRSFWNKNPFKYDSSDDEESGTSDRKKKNLTKKSDSEKPRNYFKEDLFKRDSFFFVENDERLETAFTDFLAGEEDLEEVRKKFNDLGRTELKTIARGKWKNSKRKNEKRIKIMRLIRRKKRREAKQKEMTNP